MAELLREIHYFDMGLPVHQLNLYSVCLMNLPAPRLPALVCGTLTGNSTLRRGSRAVCAVCASGDVRRIPFIPGAMWPLWYCGCG